MSVVLIIYDLFSFENQKSSYMYLVLIQLHHGSAALKTVLARERLISIPHILHSLIHMHAIVFQWSLLLSIIIIYLLANCDTALFYYVCSRNLQFHLCLIIRCVFIMIIRCFISYEGGGHIKLLNKDNDYSNYKTLVLFYANSKLTRDGEIYVHVCTLCILK